MKRIPVVVLFFAALGVTFPAGAARMYKIIDQNGNVTYTTSSPDREDAARIETKNISGGVGDDGASANLGQVASRHPVTLYSVGKCTSCDHAREYLRLHNIPFTEKDVNKDLTARAEMKQRSGALVVPTILVGTQALKGFTEPVLEDELSKAGYPVGKNAPDKGQGQQSDEEGSQDQGDQGPPAGDTSQDQGEEGGQ